MPPAEPSNPTPVGREKGDIAEAQGKDFKIAITNMIKDLKRT